MKEPQTSVYKNSDGSQGTITFARSSIYGTFHLYGGRDFKIESLKGEEHVVWAELDQAAWSGEHENEPVTVDRAVELAPHMRMETVMLNELLKKGEMDMDTAVEYSIDVYYTAELKAATADMGTFVATLIADTNHGYSNSKIPIRAKLHCLMEADIPDGQEPQYTLETFRSYLRDSKRDKNSADSMVLLVKTSTLCGRRYVDGIGRGYSMSIVRGDCAKTQHSFGHEIAHQFGLQHEDGSSNQVDTMSAQVFF